MKTEDRAALLAAMDVMHAFMDGDSERTVALIGQHGEQPVILGLLRMVSALKLADYPGQDEFRAFLHRWAVDLQLAEVGGGN